MCSSDLLAFTSYYMTSYIERCSFDPQDRLRPWRRLNDMIRLTGIKVGVEFHIAPKSRFRVRMLIFQTPYHMKDILGKVDDKGEVDLGFDDNMACNCTLDKPQGAFLPNAQLLSACVKNAQGQLDMAFVNHQFAPMFDKQIRETSHLGFHDEVMKMRVTHPNIHLVADRKTWIKNHKSHTRRVTWNVFRKLDTTIKFPPVTYSREMEGFPFKNQIPDRKIFVMFVMTPAREQVDVPMGEGINYTGFDRVTYDVGDEEHFVDTGAEYDDDHWKNRVREFPRQSSIVSNQLFPGFHDPGYDVPVAGPSELPKTPKILVPDSQDTSSTSTKGKTPLRGKNGRFVSYARDVQGNRPSVDPDADVESGIPDDDPIFRDVDKTDDRFLSTRAALVEVLALNKKRSKEERKRPREDELVDPSGLKSNDRWAAEQGLMMNPTIDLWWTEMPKPMVNLSRKRFRAVGGRKRLTRRPY